MPYWWTCPVSGHNSHRLQLGMYSNYTTTNQNSQISERPQKGTKKPQKATNWSGHKPKGPCMETATKWDGRRLTVYLTAPKPPVLRLPSLKNAFYAICGQGCGRFSFWPLWSLFVTISVCSHFGPPPFWSVAASVGAWFVTVSGYGYFGCGPLSMWPLQTVTTSQLWHSVMILFEVICCFRYLTSGNLYSVCWK